MTKCRMHAQEGEAAEPPQAARFLEARREAISLAPLEMPSRLGYVWRRIFLKGTRGA